jgi:hypothetical protein
MRSSGRAVNNVATLVSVLDQRSDVVPHRSNLALDNRRPRVPPVAVTALGFLTGVVLIPLLLRWLLLARTVFGSHGNDFLGPARRRLVWTAPVVLLLQPLPYLVLAVIAIAGLALRGRLPFAWLWLMIGFGLYAVLMGALILSRLVGRKRKARRAAHP